MNIDDLIFGSSSLDRIFEFAHDELLPFLKLLRTTLLDEKLDRFNASMIQAAAKTVMLINKIIVTCWPTQEPTEVLLIVRDIMFSWQIPNRVKIYLEEAFEMCIELEEQQNNYVMEISLKGLLELLLQNEDVQVKIYKEKYGKEFHVFLAQNMDTGGLQELFCMVISFMVGGMLRVKDQVIYSQLIFSHLSAFLTFISESNPAFQIERLKSRLTFVRCILEKLSILHVDNISEAIVQEFLSAINIHDILEDAMSFGGVRHSIEEGICSLCLSGQFQTGWKDIFDLRLSALTIMQTLYERGQKGSRIRLYNQRGEFQLIQSIMNGLRCYLSANPSRQQGQQQHKLLQGLEELSGRMLLLYMLTIKQNETILRTMVEQSQKIKELVLELMCFTAYERYLFEQKPQDFLDLLRDMSQDRELINIKTQTARLIDHICDYSPQFHSELLNIAKYYLQKNNNVFLRSWTELPNYHPRVSVSTESCFLFLSLLKSEGQLLLLQKMLSIKCLQKMSDLAITVALSYFEKTEVNVFSHQPYNMHIIDYSLRSKHPTLKLAGLRCLASISKKVYSPVYFSTTFRQIFHSETLEQSGALQRWAILSNVVNHHLQKLSIHTRCYVLSAIRKLIWKELVDHFNRRTYNESTLHLCFHISLQIASKLDYQRIHPYLKNCLIDIASLFMYLPNQTTKAEMITLIREVFLIERYSHAKVSNQLFGILQSLLEYYQQTKDLNMLTVFDYFLEMFTSRKKSAADFEATRIIYSYFFQLLQISALDENQAIYIYSTLVILNKYIQYFGEGLKKQQIYCLITKCRLILADPRSLVIIKLRARNTIFACSLHSSDEQIQFQTLQMLREVKQAQFQGYEVQPLLKTVEICLTTFVNLGPLAKYRWLLSILYEISIYSTKYQLQCRQAVPIRQLFDYLNPNFPNRDDVSKQCLRIYKEFKSCKKLAYLSVIKTLDPLVRDHFRFLDKKCAPDTACAAQEYHQMPYILESGLTMGLFTKHNSLEASDGSDNILVLISTFTKLIS